MSAFVWSRRSRPSLRVILPVAAAAVVLAGCGTGGPAYGPPPTDVAAVVEMTSGLDFVPQEVRIRAGETLEWRNQSLFRHTVTFDPVRPGNAAEAGGPQGAAAFRAEVAAGEVYRHEFERPGTYHYYCEPHEGFGMTGTVVVLPR